MPFFNELYEDLLIIKNKGEKETETCLQKPESRMDFENVISVEELGFAYPEIEKQVLNNISFSIPKGKFVGNRFGSEWQNLFVFYFAKLNKYFL